MGHQRLGTLPATRSWQRVVARIADGADAPDVAAEAASAAETSLERASDDATLRHAFFLLAAIPLAAREPAFGRALQALGLDIPDRPSLVEIVCAMVGRLDRIAAASRRTDLGEMATLAAAESLVSVAGREGGGLFGAHLAGDDARAALRALSRERQFGLLAHDFFARLLRRCLDYFLSRAKAEQVGTGKRFPSIKDHHVFDDAMATHCREASLILEDFAAGWHGKTVFETSMTRERAGGFVHIAFEKVRAELRNRAGQTVHA
jgi:hypothetical protein